MPEMEEGQLSLKTGRYGAFVGCTRYPECFHAPFAGEQAEQGDIERILGQDPETGLDVHVKDGRFCPYIQLGEAAEKGEKPNAPAFPRVKHPQR